jgi:STE24 endopeptidase
MDKNLIFALLLVVAGGGFLFGQALSVLNLRHRRGGVPASLQGFVDEERYAKSRAYQAEKGRFGLVYGCFGFALVLAMLLSGGFGWWDTQVKAVVAGDIPRALVYFGSLLLASEVAGIPWELYAVFGIEARWGFNRMTAKTFVADKLKGWLLSGLISGGLLALFIWLFGLLGSGFWLWFSLVAAVFMLLMNLLYTSLILPLFNKLTPLPEGELRAAIQAYAEANGFPLGRVLVMDGSKRSTKANAFFSGLGKQKNIVLFDTLIEKHPVEEVVAVLAHEIGHWRHGHVRMGLVLGVLQVTLTLAVLSLVVGSPVLSLALGGQAWSLPLNLLAFGLLYSPLSSLIGLGMMVLSRRHEYQADAWARATGCGPALAQGLKRLSADSLSDLYPHPWLVFWEYSHPPLLARLARLEAAAGNGPLNPR